MEARAANAAVLKQQVFSFENGEDLAIGGDNGAMNSSDQSSVGGGSIHSVVMGKNSNSKNSHSAVAPGVNGLGKGQKAGVNNHRSYIQPSHTNSGGSAGIAEHTQEELLRQLFPSWF
jgi:hypothetical protein